MPDMLSVPAAPQAPPGPQESASAPPGREPEGPPFKDVLDHHQARTAHAEGRSGGDDSPKGKDTEDDKAACSPQAAIQALALVAAPVVPVTPTATPVAAPAVTAAATPALTDGTTPAVAAAVAATTAVADLAPAAAAQLAGVPAQQADAKATADAGIPVPLATAGAETKAEAAPADAAPLAVPADRPATRPGDAKTAVAQAAQPAAAAPAQPADVQAPGAATQPVADTTAAAATVASAQPAAAQATATQAAERDDAPAGPQGPSAPVAPQAAAHAHRAPAPVAPAPVSPLNTAHAVERIQAMVHVAHAHGVAHARVELHPAELGGVTIQLHVAHDGLRAHVTADRADALPLLQRAAADLQRTLENRGIDLAGLDFGLAPDAEAGASRDDGRAQQRGNAFGTTRDSDGEPDGDDDVLVTSATGTTRSVELPAGALVDVRA